MPLPLLENRSLDGQPIGRCPVCGGIDYHADHGAESVKCSTCSPAPVGARTFQAVASGGRLRLREYSAEWDSAAPAQEQAAEVERRQAQAQENRQRAGIYTSGEFAALADALWTTWQLSGGLGAADAKPGVLKRICRDRHPIEGRQVVTVVPIELAAITIPVGRRFTASGSRLCDAGDEDWMVDLLANGRRAVCGVSVSTVSVEEAHA